VKKLKKLVGYCRVSTDNQKEEGTIEIQEKSLKRYVEKNSYELVKVFKDNGVSGGSELENRPGLPGHKLSISISFVSLIFFRIA